MSASIRSLLLTTLAVGHLLLTPATSWSESAMGHGRGSGSASASATVILRVVIPPEMRLLHNSHPATLPSSADGPVTAEQRLVVVSNLPRGFCISLRRASPESGGWQLQTPEPGDSTLTPIADGYRLCTTRPGRHSLLLQHAFAGSTTAQHWPVQTELVAL